MENAVTVKELRKSYGDIKAVDGISFEIPQGSFFAFLGPNGAGKSTTIQILTSILKQDSGEASIFGRSPRIPSRNVPSAWSSRTRNWINRLP